MYKMSDQQPIKILKKRGRKPKNKVPEFIYQKDESPVSEKEVIITYLPINLNDIESNKNDEEDDIFIKSESYFTDTKTNKVNNVKYCELSEEKNNNFINSIDSEINKSSVTQNFNRINIYNVEFDESTKCWWCKNKFTTPRLGMPEEYYNDTFYCKGNYCSWECMKASNSDINDLFSWKRESLINLMYYLTYGTFKEIKHASHWLTLKEFGGHLTIAEFRKNFELVNNDFLVLHPPLVSRQMQIEESYKKNTNTGIVVNKLDKLLFESNNLVLKRSKPIETTQINLEKSMGLKRFIK